MDRCARLLCKHAHEFEIATVATSDVIVTDSLAKVDVYGTNFFLTDTPDRARMIEFSNIVS